MGELGQGGVPVPLLTWVLQPSPSAWVPSSVQGSTEPSLALGWQLSGLGLALTRLRAPLAKSGKDEGVADVSCRRQLPTQGQAGFGAALNTAGHWGWVCIRARRRCCNRLCTAPA